MSAYYTSATATQDLMQRNPLLSFIIILLISALCIYFLHRATNNQKEGDINETKNNTNR